MKARPDRIRPGLCRAWRREVDPGSRWGMAIWLSGDMAFPRTPDVKWVIAERGLDLQEHDSAGHRPGGAPRGGARCHLRTGFGGRDDGDLPNSGFPGRDWGWRLNPEPGEKDDGGVGGPRSSREHEREVGLPAPWRPPTDEGTNSGRLEGSSGGPTTLVGNGLRQVLVRPGSG